MLKLFKEITLVKVFDPSIGKTIQYESKGAKIPLETLMQLNKRLSNEELFIQKVKGVI